MNIRRIEPLPTPENPFKDDLLDREAFARRMVAFLGNVEGPFTMALSGPFGSGKTFFLRRCKLMLDAANVPTVILNAWETDFASEPLTPLITELSEKFSEHLPAGATRWRKAKKLTARYVAASVPLGVKLITAGILDADDFKVVAAAGEAAEKFAEKQFEQFKAAKKTITSLKAELSDLTAAVRKARQSSNAEAAPPPFVVLIDELDRCRPSYSIELLEVVKHFFELPGIVFVIAVDRAQLVSSARALFGEGLDGDGYLRKFLDLELSLPTPSITNFVLNITANDGPFFSWRQHAALREPLARLCQGARFSLRRTQQFITRAEVAVSSGSNIAGPDDIMLLVFVRDFDLELYERFLAGKATAWNVFSALQAVDPLFGQPTYNGGLYFVELLAGVGRDEQPKPFIDLLRADYESKNLPVGRLDWLQRGSGTPHSYLLKIAEAVDFCAAVAV